MKSGLPPAAWAIRSRSSPETASPISASASSGGERLQPQRPRPAGAPFDQLRPGHAQEQERRAGREQRRRLDQVEERLVAPLDVVEDHDQRRLLLEQLAERPGDLVPARPDVRLAQQRADRRRRDRIRRQRRELLHHLDDRPVGDPLPVGQAAAPHDAGLDRGERLRDQPRLAHTGVADDRHQLAARLRLRALPRLGDLRELRLAPDEPRERGCAPARPAPRRAGSAGTGSDFPFNVSGSTGSATTASCTSACVASPISTSPGAAACSNRAATFTASPVASRSARPGHHLARVHADPAADPQLRQRIPHLHRRPAGPQRIVLVRRGDAEHRHHRVADELLHRPAVRLDDRLHPLEVARQQRPQRLRIRRLAERRRPGHVAEQHRHRLADLARSAPPSPAPRRSRCRSRRLPGSPAHNSRR